MRPLKLTIAGFGPYVGVQELDFEALGKSEPYLITGDTGAGKTTIFDAITFALFGKASGADREDGMLRSKYIGPKDPSYVELTFSHGGKIYTVNRTTKFKKETKNGTFINQSSNATLTLPNGDPIAKTDEVNDAILEIIGLNSSQFSQVSMISQGAFRELLQAKVSLRQSIFREIFDTKVYEKLQDKLSVQAGEVKKQCDQVSQSIRQYKEGIACDEDSLLLPEVKKAQEDKLPTAEVMELLEALCAADESLQDQLTNSEKLLEIRQEEIAAQLATVKLYEDAQKALAQLKTDQARKTDDLSNGAVRLQNARSTEADQDKLRDDIASLKQLLPVYDELDVRCQKLTLAENDLNDAMDQQNRALHTIQNLSDFLEQLRSEQRCFENPELEKEKVKGQCQELEKRKLAMNELLEKLNRLTKDRARLRDLQNDYLEADAKRIRLLEDYESKNRAFLNMQAGLLASTLKEGMACWVCGSTHHPKLAHLPEDTPTEVDVQRARKTYDEANKAALKANEDASNQFVLVKDREETLLRELSVLLPGVELAHAEEAIHTQLEVTDHRLCELNKQLNKLNRDISRKQELDVLIPENENLLTAEKGKLAEIESLIAADTAAIREVNEQIDHLKQKLTFPDKQTLEQTWMTMEDELRSLKKERDAAEEAVRVLREQLAAIEASIDQLNEQVAEVPQGTTEELTQQRNELLQQKNTISGRKNVIYNRLTVNRNAKRKIAEKADQLEELESRLSWMESLSRTANGRVPGKDRIDLETYIQSVFFERIVQHANIRLQKMSGGQYQLKRREQSEDKRQISGLELDIVDYINSSQRSVKTLSGGEAFLASLALALGMSDEIQMSSGVRLETLFIDEGFGSLDSEALRKAYNTLISLSDGDCLVGIISHVPELKERIEKQIVVSKLRSGGSSAKIVVP